MALCVQNINYFKTSRLQEFVRRSNALRGYCLDLQEWTSSEVHAVPVPVARRATARARLAATVLNIATRRGPRGNPGESPRGIQLSSAPRRRFDSCPLPWVLALHPGLNDLEMNGSLFRDRGWRLHSHDDMVAYVSMQYTDSGGPLVVCYGKSRQRTHEYRNTLIGVNFYFDCDRASLSRKNQQQFHSHRHRVTQQLSEKRFAAFTTVDRISRLLFRQPEAFLSHHARHIDRRDVPQAVAEK